MRFPTPKSRRSRLGVAAALVASIAIVPAASQATAAAKSPRPVPLAPVGIVDATPKEQAAVLALMTKTHAVVVDGYTFWVGEMAGVPVVNVAGGEDDNAAELVTLLLDTTFHPRATIFSGTAGAANNKINVGDVVLSGFVVDKRSVEYDDDGTNISVNSAEIHDTGHSDLNGAIVAKYDKVFPTPANASTYAASSPKSDPTWQRVLGFASTQQLVTTASGAGGILGSTTVADATGITTKTGSVANKIVVGTIGAGAIWTNPLSVTEAQNSLYQTDAEEDEGLGFAFANASAGVPWVLVRGISDSPWYPEAYDQVLGTTQAAAVTKYTVTHLGRTISKAAVTLSSLSSIANAQRAGYLIATKAAYGVTPVSEVGFTDVSGVAQDLTGDKLTALESEYAEGSGDLG